MEDKGYLVDLFVPVLYGVDSQSLIIRMFSLPGTERGSSLWEIL